MHTTIKYLVLFTLIIWKLSHVSQVIPLSFCKVEYNVALDYIEPVLDTFLGPCIYHRDNKLRMYSLQFHHSHLFPRKNYDDFAKTFLFCHILGNKTCTI
jgi:hypothetical protein